MVVEAESSKIGQLNLPPSLWDAMKSAPWIEVTAPVSERAAYLANAYEDILADGAALKAKLDPLRRFRGHDTVDTWFGMIDRGERRALCAALATEHYDPAYETSMKAVNPRIVARVAADRLDPAALEDIAGRIEAALYSTTSI